MLEEQREETVSVARQEIRAGLDALFLPDSVAVIGATERTGTVGRTILENLLHPSFPERYLPLIHAIRRFVGTEEVDPSASPVTSGGAAFFNCSSSA